MHGMLPKLSQYHFYIQILGFDKHGTLPNRIIHTNLTFQQARNTAQTIPVPFYIQILCFNKHGMLPKFSRYHFTYKSYVSISTECRPKYPSTILHTNLTFYVSISTECCPNDPSTILHTSLTFQWARNAAQIVLIPFYIQILCFD